MHARQDLLKLKLSQARAADSPQEAGPGTRALRGLISSTLRNWGVKLH